LERVGTAYQTTPLESKESSMTGKDVERDFEGDGMHVISCVYVCCVCASPCERYVFCLGVER